MDSSQNIDLKTLVAISNFIKAYIPSFTPDFPEILEAKNIIDGHVGRILAYNKIQMEGTKGETAFKISIKDSALEIAVTLHGGILAFAATPPKDVELDAKYSEYMPTSIRKTPDMKVYGICDIMIEGITPILDKVGKYKITNSTITELKALIDSYKLSIEGQSTTDNLGVNATADMKDEFTVANKYVSDDLTKMFKPFIKLDKTVHDAFLQAKKKQGK